MPFLKSAIIQQEQITMKQTANEITNIDTVAVKPKNSSKKGNAFTKNQHGTTPKDRLKNFWKTWHKDATNRGFLYERYVGYIYEKAGYDVFYNGILHGGNDMGRDLICSKAHSVIIVQCKCLSTGNVYPKSVHQLYGTSIQYGLKHPDKIVRGMLFTTVGFTYDATFAAGVLGIFLKGKLRLPNQFPIVRCVSKTKQYYLPDDWDYFFSGFDIRNGDMYYQTTDAAEHNGFVWAHQPSQQN